MGIIQDLQAKMIELEKINDILSTKINSLELFVANLSSIVPNIKQNSISPELKKTLDVPNLYLGEKGISSYDKFGKLDIEFDETDNLWKARGGTIDGGLFKLELLSEGTEFIEVPDWTPTIGDTYRTNPLNVYDTFDSSETSIRGYFLVREYTLDRMISEIIYPTSYISNIDFVVGTYDVINRRFRINIVTANKGYAYRSSPPPPPYIWYLNQYDTFNVHYKLYKITAMNGEDFGDYSIIM